MRKPFDRLFVSEQDYLELELDGAIRHEYIDGQTFAMTGATDAHNRICGNLFAALHSHASKSECAVYMNDMKVKIAASKSYYYPDLLVSCEPYSAKTVFKSAPILLVEVLSPSTQSTDKREKLVAYKAIADLKHYLVIHQNRMRIEVYSRDENFQWQLLVLQKDEMLEIENLCGKPFEIQVTEIYGNCEPFPYLVSESEEEYSF